MPCLTNIIPLYLSKDDQKASFYRSLCELANDLSSSIDENDQQRIFKKIEELRDEVSRLKLLVNDDVPKIQEIFEYYSLLLTHDFIRSFL